LLSILPSPDLRLSNVITVSWDGAAEPSRENLRKFCAIRKQKVAQALYWLCRHNPLWRDHVTVNEELLQSWPEEFIPEDLLENAIRTEPGLSDNREGYAMDREEIAQDDSDEVFENDLDRLCRDANPGTVVTGAFLQDPEGNNDGWRDRQAALFAELEAAHNEAANEKGMPLPHIKYRSAFGVEILNSWLSETYLLAAFPDLFPHGEASLPTRQVSPSLCPWRNSPNDPPLSSVRSTPHLSVRLRHDFASSVNSWQFPTVKEGLPGWRSSRPFIY
jgi:hypothetical protein